MCGGWFEGVRLPRSVCVGLQVVGPRDSNLCSF